MATPPGVSEQNFNQALKQFRDTIGGQWVFTDDSHVDTYKDAYSPLWGEPEESKSSAALAPDSVEQIRQILKIANRYSIPLYTVSTGRNLAYGGAAPVHSGSVVLDLKRMNRILEVSEENAYALVEPGVSYFDLYRYLQEKGINLWIDPPDPGWGSFIGNALDHGAGRTPLPYRDHFDAHCGMEVVLANGDVVRTGMGAVPGSKLWQQTKYGAGPMVDGIFSQSNFGIVTKMGFWLMPAPEATMTGTIRLQQHDDVIPMVRTLASLMYSNMVDCHYEVLSPVFLGPADTQAGALWDKPGGGTAEEWDSYARSRDLHFWETTLRFYGSPKVMAAKWEYVQERFSEIKGVEFEDGELLGLPLTDEQIKSFGELGVLGVPSLNVFSGLAMTPNITGHLDASILVPLSGEEILKSHRVFARVFREAGMEYSFGYAQSYHTRTFIVFLGMSTTRDREQNAKVRSTYEKIVKTAAEHGWGTYRTHIAYMDEVMATYSYNDNALMKMHETLKDALDPNGILSAGRYGIWPKHLRKS